MIIWENVLFDWKGQELKVNIYIFTDYILVLTYTATQSWPKVSGKVSENAEIKHLH